MTTPTPLRQLGAIHASMEAATRSGEFVAYAKHLLAAKGFPATALQYAQDSRATPGVLSVLKSAVQAGGTTATSDWGSELATFSNGFVGSLAAFGAYDKILSDGAFVRVPVRTKIAVVTIAATVAPVAEAAPKPISKVVFSNPQLEGRKSSAIVVVSEELARSASASAFSLLGNELRRGIATATDTDFFRAIIENNDVDTVASSGATLDAVIADLSTALVLISIGANSRIYICAPPKVVRAWALLRGTSGAPAFPELGILGGTIAGASVVPSDALSDTVVIVDAAQVAADSGPVLLDASSQTSLQLDDDPSSGEQSMTSLWQSNLRALRAERWWASELLRSSGAVVISGVSVDVGTGT